MNEKEFEDGYEEARIRHLAAMASQTEAVERNAAALASMVGFGAVPPVTQYEYRRQPGSSADDWQPVPPGPEPEWDIYHIIENVDFLAYYWRKPVNLLKPKGEETD